jgi:ribosomal protein L7/L12
MQGILICNTKNIYNMDIDQEQQVEIENCLKSIRKLKLNGLAELNRKFKEEFNIQEEAFTSPSTAKVEEPKEEASAVNVNLKILTVDGDDIKKAFYVYKTVKTIISKIDPSRPSNLGEIKSAIDQGKLILENIPEKEAKDYKKQLENDEKNP